MGLKFEPKCFLVNFRYSNGYSMNDVLSFMKWQSTKSCTTCFGVKKATELYHIFVIFFRDITLPCESSCFIKFEPYSSVP